MLEVQQMSLHEERHSERPSTQFHRDTENSFEKKTNRDDEESSERMPYH